MAELLRKTWQSSFTTGVSRRDRRGCLYDAYLPDKLMGQTLSLDGEVAADVAEAEAAIARLNLEVTALTDTEALARLLLRAESVASSRIEGLVVGGRRLLQAEALRQTEPAASSDVTAIEVLNNIDAMQAAIAGTSPGGMITLESLLDVHRRLLQGGRLEEHGGTLREVQNWIGGSGFNPCSAAFVPPPPEAVAGLMEDLVAFCNQDALPAVVQAAIAHAQFETIHPFIDGNGRTGRALIQVVLRRRGLAARVVPPVSLILATLSGAYIAGLTGYRYVGTADSAAAHTGVNSWIATFAAACHRAVEDALRFEADIREIQQGWRQRLGSVRAGSALDRLIERLPGAPVLTPTTAADLSERSFQAANQAIDRLVEAGILHQITIGRRNRAFEAPQIIDAFNALERQLASPEGDTRAAPPVRGVPQRRSRR